MFRNSLILAALTALSVSSFAANSAADAGRTNADVRAEAVEAVKANTTQHGETYVVQDRVKLTKTWAQVRAEALEAVKAGTTQRGEAYVVQDHAQLTKTRAQVRAELEQYKASGQMDRDRAQPGA